MMGWTDEHWLSHGVSIERLHCSLSSSSAAGISKRGSFCLSSLWPPPVTASVLSGSAAYHAFAMLALRAAFACPLWLLGCVSAYPRAALQNACAKSSDRSVLVLYAIRHKCHQGQREEHAATNDHHNCGRGSCRTDVQHTQCTACAAGE